MPGSARVTPVEVEDELLDRSYVAAWLGVVPATLARWEREGGGPDCLRLGDLVRYRRSSVKKWLRSQAKRRKRRSA
jgi:predicted DNA-binding transcriptional regulator AlpA